MPINSVGILMYRHSGDGVEVLLVHPGGLFGANVIWAPGRCRKENTTIGRILKPQLDESSTRNLASKLSALWSPG